MIEAKEYLSGTLDLGALGKIRLLAFKNENKKEGDKQPEWRLYVKGIEDKPKEVGALWLNKLKVEFPKQQDSFHTQSGASEEFVK